ncbi:unnamed protein product [Tilletia controversa]|uniref:BZIP domain-containing protein n=3 Tax=Tilletia TaxID=13289 RepID=A0A8X7SV43_9BASI|nr:hypothetical protein A4X06_0g6127 [Tilletia controversa]KAE8245869.1 hypothetical protein A4X03_0g7395 [Tilletia caries]CAD6944634.1 unnamed protein product [Tilletia laevis]CAD6896699.1 unnamed protein product [Tilletia controversa]CAD6922095.1 unnamed protein product [Tilletia caries]
MADAGRLPSTTAALPASSKGRGKGKQRSASSNEGTGSASGNDRGSASASGSLSGSASANNGSAAASGSGPSHSNNFDNSGILPTPEEDASILSANGNGGGEEKKTRKQVQRRYRGRQAEYVKKLETEIELLKADPSFRESAKDEWIQQLQEDNRQLKAFILGPHRITLTEGMDVLLRKSYAIEEGILRPFVTSPVIENAPGLPEDGSAQDLPDFSNFSNPRRGEDVSEEAINGAADQGRTTSSHNSYMGSALAGNASARNSSTTSNIPPGNLFLGGSNTSTMPTNGQPFGAQSQLFALPSADHAAPAQSTTGQFSLRFPANQVQQSDPTSFEEMTQFLSSTAMAGNINIPWQAQGDVSGAGSGTGTGAYGNGSRPDEQILPNRAIGGASATSNFNAGAAQPLSHQYPDLTSSAMLTDSREISPGSAGVESGGLVANRHTSDDAKAGGRSNTNASSNTTRSSSAVAQNFFVASQSSTDGPPLAQKRRVGGYLGMNHDDSADAGLPGGQSGGSGGPSPIHVLPSQLYSQREQLSAMIRYVFDTPGSSQIDFSSPDFSYEPYQQRLEPIFRFCWSWAMAIWPDEPEMEVASMAWVIFLFSNAAVNFYLKLPEFLQPTREQQSLPHEAAVMFVPWKELRNQMVLLDGFVNFRIVGELVNCTCLQAGQYKPNAGPIGAPKPASAYGQMRHIKELTYFDENFIPFDHIIDFENWRLSRDAISRFPQLEIPERLIEAGDVRKRKEQAWAQQKGSQGVFTS